MKLDRRIYIVSKEIDYQKTFQQLYSILLYDNGKYSGFRKIEINNKFDIKTTF